jgi:hypothetical protein
MKYRAKNFILVFLFAQDQETLRDFPEMNDINI